MPAVHLRERLLAIALAAAIALIAWIMAWPQLGGPGMTWDEAYYYPTFVDVRDWTGLLLSNPGLALSHEGIAAGWEEIHELPPVVKWLGALSVSLGADGWSILGWMRLVPAVFFGVTLFLIYRLTRTRPYDPLAGFFMLLYALHPRVFGHAQIAATETVFAGITMIAAWAALQDLSKWRWRVVLAVVAGIALATKVNGLILIAAIGFWLVTRRWLEQGFRKEHAPAFLRRDLLPLGLIAVVTPLVSWAIWPWMWHDTAARIGTYIDFIRFHSHQGVWFLGEKWNFTEERAPVYYPLVMLHVTTPAVNLFCLWAGGAAVVWRSFKAKAVNPRVWLFFLLAAAPFAAASLPGSPKYDGIRLFFPMLAPAFVFAAKGWQALAGKRNENDEEQARFRPIDRLAFALLVIAALESFGPPRLSYYNPPARILAPDDEPFPFEITYWGDAIDQEVIENVNDILPTNARLKTLALQPAIFTTYQDWEVLRGDIAINPPPPYDVHLMLNRKGFWGRAEWHLHDHREPMMTWGEACGEPLVFLYDGRPPGTD